MSVRVTAWVWKYSKATAMDRFVLVAIADHASDDGSDAYPSVALLVEKTGLHERSVQRSLRALEALGELVIHRNAGPKGCNRYRINMTDPRHTATPGTQPPPAHSHPRHTATPGTESPRQSAGGVADSHPTPGTQPPPPPAVRHPNRPLTILEPKAAAGVRTKEPRPLQAVQLLLRILEDEAITRDEAEQLACNVLRDRKPRNLPGLLATIGQAGELPALLAEMRAANAVEADREATAGDRRRATAAEAETKRAAIAACELCDQVGYVGRTICTHDPASTDRSRNGAAAARAALIRTENVA